MQYIVLYFAVYSHMVLFLKGMLWNSVLARAQALVIKKKYLLILSLSICVYLIVCV